jgi:transmembrane sensor
LSGGILVAALSAILTFWPRSLGFGGGTSQAIYRTDIGGLKDVHLLDGSTVVLGARTQLAVAFSGQRRSVRVIQGQAWFKVAHDTRWPFVVTAGGGTITDIGTAFLVTRDSDRVVVTVMEGAVEVSTRSVMRRSFTPDEGLVLGPALAPVRITRGEQVAFSDAGTLSALKQTDTHAAVAWTQGQLTFDNQPLRYVVETVNRYYQRRILVSPSAGSLRFSGIISDTAIGDWLRSLKIIFPVVIESHGAIVTIQMRSSNLGSAHLLPSKRH